MNTVREETVRRVLVDDLGRIKARVAEFTTEEKKLRDQLIQLYGFGEHDGDLFRATVTKQVQERLDTQAVRGLLTKQQLRRVTTITEVTIVKVNARISALANR